MTLFNHRGQNVDEILVGEVEEPEWAEEKKALDKAVEELSRVCQGTHMQLTLSGQLLTVQLDICIDMLCTAGILNRKEFIGKVKMTVEDMISQVRRALLSSGAPIHRRSGN